MSTGPCTYPRCTDGEGNPVLTSLGICDNDRIRYGQVIRWLADDYATLRLGLPSPTIRGVRVRTTTREEFGHPAEWASDEARSIALLLNQIEDGLREYSGQEPADHPGIFQDRLALQGFAYLALHFESLCTYPEAGTAATAIVDKHRTIRAGLGYTRQADKLPTPCPKCNTVGLVSLGGNRAVIECQACGHRVRPEHYEYLTKVAAETAITTSRASDWDLLDRYDDANSRREVEHGWNT
ncbi:hypothetical protein FJV46_10615 [Arthrobacter agilis]|uniref:hypothetical protein n=1 Tax=Arthrobacter agilis TaxID=37921 RepID=UPI000B361E47|nr:hypothetical protein [Arthrobacter agilis]OUM44172.1 hypothetical protein B8W74_04670 [Arthrobacter agilis]PPB46547.1 hypothetical protein CI784_06965 [Arthrobacter agilis]TPV23797.1 hypothetical protein FJV46_10615 [Arthrobacter agilis]VDR32529.1 Uncharacterised protein [Arthrobacter agilis]